MSAFKTISSGNIQYEKRGILDVTKGTDKLDDVFVPTSTISNLPTAQALKSYLKIAVSALAGTNGVLTIQVQNLTEGSGEIIEAQITEIGTSYICEISSKPGDNLRYSYSYTADEVDQKASFDVWVLSQISGVNF